MSKKSIWVIALCIGIGIMAVGYAAFSTTLTINTTVSGAGLNVKLGCNCSVGTAGLAGATAPTATCTPTSLSQTTTGTMTAQLYQPGDSVTCTYSIQNDSEFNVEVNDFECGSLTSPFTASHTSIADGTVIASGSSKTFTLTMGYLSSITSQPGTTDSGTVTCKVPVSQVG